MPTSTPWTSQSKKVSSATTPAVSSQILATNSRGPFQTASYDADVSWKQSPVSKRKKQEMSDAFQGALINALKEPTTQITDPLDGFVCRLAEGMRRLPYCERARLEITFLTLLAEKEELCNNRNMEPRY
ncbi:uncharacterized protein LOC105283785 isoform X2 [Ooceraea biroi]|nr:uncharacterized protein LOC105283785 isoform X2 [Ooceraea biroi]